MPLRCRRGADVLAAGILVDCEAMARLRLNQPDFLTDIKFPVALGGTQLPNRLAGQSSSNAEVVKLQVMPNDARLQKSFKIKVSSIPQLFKLGC